MQEMNSKVQEFPNAPTNKAPKGNFAINFNVDPTQNSQRRMYIFNLKTDRKNV